MRPEAAKIPMFDTYNRTAASQRVADIVEALRATPDAVLVGVGDAALAGMLALTVETERRAVLDVGDFDTSSDAAFLERLYMPGLRRAGDLSTAAALVGDRAVIHNAGARFTLDGVTVNREKLTPKEIVAMLRVEGTEFLLSQHGGTGTRRHTFLYKIKILSTSSRQPALSRPNHEWTGGCNPAPSMDSQRLNDISFLIIQAAIEVHRTLGPGLLESTVPFLHDLRVATARPRASSRSRLVPIRYKEVIFEGGYRLDLQVEDQVIVEIKAVENLLPVHHAQLLSYLRLTRKPIGLLINFNVPVLD